MMNRIALIESEARKSEKTLFLIAQKEQMANL